MWVRQRNLISPRLWTFFAPGASNNPFGDPISFAVLTPYFQHFLSRLGVESLSEAILTAPLTASVPPSQRHLEHPLAAAVVKRMTHVLQNSSEPVREAPGVRGNRYLALTHPEIPYVFKIYLTQYAQPVSINWIHVLPLYLNRFENRREQRILPLVPLNVFSMPRRAILDQFLEDLRRILRDRIGFRDDRIVLRNLHIQEKTIPLNVYLEDPKVTEEDKEKAVIDYGYCIKDLAQLGIFQGDYLPRNFGVTSGGAVACFDFESMDHLSRFYFCYRSSPCREDGSEAEEYAGENDVYPFEIFYRWAPLSGFEAVFRHYHEDLLSTGYWNELKIQCTRATP